MLRKPIAPRAAKRTTAADLTGAPAARRTNDGKTEPNGHAPRNVPPGQNGETRPMGRRRETSTALVSVPRRAVTPPEPAIPAETAKSEGPLTAAEKRDFDAAETTIERGKLAFIATGCALAEIREARWFREKYATWEEYLRDRWGFGRQEAADKISAARVAAIVSPISDAAQIPLVEDHLKALAPLKDPGDVEAVFQQGIRRASKEKAALTGKLLREEVRRYMTPPDELETEHDGGLKVVGASERYDSWHKDTTNLADHVRTLATVHSAAERRSALATLLRNLADEVGSD